MMLTRSGDEIYIRTSGFPVDIDSDYVPLCGSLECNQGRGKPCGNNCAEVKAAQAEGARMSNAPRAPRVMPALFGPYRRATWWRIVMRPLVGWSRLGPCRFPARYPRDGRLLGAKKVQPQPRHSLDRAPRLMAKEEPHMMTRSGDEVHIKTSGFAVDIDSDYVPLCGSLECNRGRGEPCDNSGAEVKAAQAEGARMASPRVMPALIGYRKATWWRKLWARWREWRADRMWPKGVAR